MHAGEGLERSQIDARDPLGEEHIGAGFVGRRITRYQIKLDGLLRIDHVLLQAGQRNRRVRRLQIVDGNGRQRTDHAGKGVVVIEDANPHPVLIRVPVRVVQIVQRVVGSRHHRQIRGALLPVALQGRRNRRLPQHMNLPLTQHKRTDDGADRGACTEPERQLGVGNPVILCQPVEEIAGDEGKRDYGSDSLGLVFCNVHWLRLRVYEIQRPNANTK